MTLRLGVAVLALLLASGCQRASALVGKPAPEFSLTDLSGRAVRLANLKGRVVFLNVWATWCEPCREEMPSIDRLLRSMEGRPFAVLAVNLAEPQSRIRTYLEKTPVGFPVLLDRDTSVAKAWKARILPTTYVVGPDGRIRFSYVGELDWSQEKVRRAIAALLPP